MTQVDKIRNYLREHPEASHKEVSEQTGVVLSNVKAFIHKDKASGKCIQNEDGTIDYSPFFEKKEGLAELVDFKNDIRRESVEILMDAARKETDPNVMRLLIKEANKLLKEITR
ncbi:hypothetical protein HZZ02_04830 [Streptococcus danieliae]|nr:hypothetical protein [Streptococcus danieliae]